MSSASEPDSAVDVSLPFFYSKKKKLILAGDFAKSTNRFLLIKQSNPLPLLLTFSKKIFLYRLKLIACIRYFS